MFRRIVMVMTSCLVALAGLLADQSGAGSARAQTLTATRAPTGPVWLSVSGGWEHTCGIRTDHTLWCWGRNVFGQLGMGDTTDRALPTQVGIDADWVRVNTGRYHTCGIREDSSLWCWGDNLNGQLGLGDTAFRYVPTRVGTAFDWMRVAPGAFHTCGIRTDRTLWCWGVNGWGELGVGDTEDRHVPTLVGGARWLSVTLGENHTCGIRGHHTLWCWGGNLYGQLGLGDTTQRNIPTRVGVHSDWARVSAAGSDVGDQRGSTCGIRADHSLWCWGYNGYGQLGVGDSLTRLVPTRVGIDKNWLRVTASERAHTCGTRVDHALWCWGLNIHGQLGLGDRTDRHTPEQVGVDTDWARANTGADHTCGTRWDHTLWCWGNDETGVLGVPGHRDRTVPTQV